VLEDDLDLTLDKTNTSSISATGTEIGGTSPGRPEYQPLRREFLDLVTDRRVEEIDDFVKANPKLKADINATLDKNRTFLHYAVYRGKKEIVDLLLSFGANVEAQDSNGRTPLHYAAANKKIQLIQSLVENGANVNAQDREGRTPIHYAALGGYGEIVFKIICMGGDANKQDYYSNFPLDYCCSKKCQDIMKQNFDAKNAPSGRTWFDKTQIANSLYDRKRTILSRISYAQKALNRQEQVRRLMDDVGKSGEISHKDFIIHDILGKGSFGEVYLVEKRDTEKLYAMKVFSKRTVQSQNLTRFIYIEKKIMHNLDSPFMVKLHYAFQTDRKLYLLMDYCKNRDLGYLLKKKGCLSEQVSRIIIAELVLAIEALHARDIVHRDLKPDNILIDDDGHIKVTDFGLAKEGMKKGVLTKTFCGSIAYLPPEIIKKEGHNKMVDWYLVGIILYELLCGKPPYFSKTFPQLSWNILNAKLAFPQGLSLNTKKFIKKLINRDPGQRLGAKKGAEEIKKHDFFIGIDWDQIQRREIAPFDPAELNPYKTNNYKQSIIDDAGGMDIAVQNWSFIAEDS
jgi:serine/threonine protein kinase